VAQDKDYEIVIYEIKDDVVWVQFNNDGKPIYRVPLAQCLRDYLRPYYDKDVKSGEVKRGLAPEQAFEKLRISKALESELMRA
jgi:hypothetical protein